jgi:hypothetical protein
MACGTDLSRTFPDMLDALQQAVLVFGDVGFARQRRAPGSAAPATVKRKSSRSAGTPRLPLPPAVGKVARAISMLSDRGQICREGVLEPCHLVARSASGCYSVRGPARPLNETGGWHGDRRKRS